MTAWNVDAGSAGTGTGAVTLVEGSSFSISAEHGDMSADRPHGVFHNDTRIVSRWDLRVNEEPLEPLAAMVREPYRATFLARVKNPEQPDSTLLMERERRVGTGLREDITMRNLGREPATCTVTLAVEADFADLFEVKEGRIRRRGDYSFRTQSNRMLIDHEWNGRRQGVVVQADDATSVHRGMVTFEVVIPPHDEWSTTVLVRPVVDGEELRTHFPVDRPVEESVPARRFQTWSSSSPRVTTDNEPLQAVLSRSQQDLGALRVFDPRHPDRAVVAAGAPWFMALFGRDSLLTSFMALPIDQSLALGTLQTLADYQGAEEDPSTEEQPGRILHEVRPGTSDTVGLGGGNVYYGTADATPLFVVLLGELHRWGLASKEVEALLPHADRALEWILHHGDLDGDGFVEYHRANEQGLLNQGWKDSWDGVNFADGRLAEAPIALCEVQAYVYGAYRARAHFASDMGDEQTARTWTDHADRLKKAFNERFWLPERGYYALALDRDNRPVDSCTSNMGHCLWTGIIDEDKAPLVAERLLDPTMFTGWGVRTLASDMGAYNPVSYHNGSVWPHDNAIVAAGLMRYGFVEHAQRIAMGMLEAATRFDDRLPELFCGFARDAYPDPVPYPTSCSPQAWAAATPIHLVRTLLRFDPQLPHGELWLDPAFPPAFGRLCIDQVPIAGSRLSIDVDQGSTTVDGLPDGVRLVRQVRRLTPSGDQTAPAEPDRNSDARER
ncbi:glycogen debranching enzyme [Nocardiopsis arvandica]|uniref:Glycogen debranching enzyme n=1 Tax=Nocardiopsis sinuspersici TaxID=501010 RepID=A0A7Z0BKP7_9ACTN|nr:amylo-alpha-1,6-glucosidase [Nocardiopsis sinuspersici]NYH55068.1 glycogen debranching enzyme [Nocardiopsis sinuspersici]